ncbi:MAG: N-acetyl-D-Glu racemase DgcA [Oligoflexales bacterium]
MLTIHSYSESWPIKGSFNISRGSKTTAEVILVEIHEQGRLLGRGEGVPYPRYGETVSGCLKSIKEVSPKISKDPSRQKLLELLPAGAARNALDCALWDYEAKKQGKPVWELAQLSPPQKVGTAYTIGIDKAELMAKRVEELKDWDLFKLKLKGTDDLKRVEAVRDAAPWARIIVDANEAWELEQLSNFLPELKRLRVELVEQPLPAGADQALETCARLVPICADESCHTLEDIDKCRDKYDYVNIKLDKTGGLTEALSVLEAAKRAKFGIMLGCMVCTSLSIAPAFLLANQAQIVDLDGPLLLTKDRGDGIRQSGSQIVGPKASFWGHPL